MCLLFLWDKHIYKSCLWWWKSRFLSDISTLQAGTPFLSFCLTHSGTISAHRCTINNAASLTRLRLLRGFVCAPPFYMTASRWVATFPWKNLRFSCETRHKLTVNRHFILNLYCYQGFFFRNLANAGKHLMLAGQEVTVSAGIWRTEHWLHCCRQKMK